MPPQRVRKGSDWAAVIGFVLLAIIIIWGLFHAFRLGSPWFSSLFTKKLPAGITLTAPASVKSGEPFTLTWKYDTKQKGIYTYIYQCQGAVKFDTAAAGGGSITIPCGTAFTVASSDKKISLTPTLTGSVAKDVPMSIVFVPSDSSARLQGNATVKVTPGATVVEEEKPATPSAPAKPSKPSTPVAVKPKAPADLYAQILLVGVIDNYTGQFVARAPQPGEIAAVQFDIANIGGTPTGSYSFEANLPVDGGYVYQSPPQNSLGAGDHVVSTLRFSNPVPGMITIQVYPGGKDGKSGNNYASQQLWFPYAMPQQQYPQYQPQYQYDPYNPYQQQYPQYNY